ncbi:transporter substrate-binding domain-containing protein [Suttonella sp. R2A3]|uniref:transporter substrate-binding domain-containing protein n=1 Tax=Suttonella sp. R2A3 TaxID=2908648 RepID=UPI001F2E1F44|nr:transporter substrate-binding domain-containing protein [Suttonella sp. R2A3]UJF24919.1 transporter substrate-binding domain-containing protein [Suttonella sp. R2A3]
MKKVILSAAIAALSFSATAETLRVATDGTYPPFSELGPDGEMTGFDIDIAKALCAEMGVECEVKQVEWDGLIPALKTRKIDAIIASMNATEDRRKSVTFSEPYYSNPGVFARPVGSNVEISEAGLKGKVLGVLRASVFDDYATNELGDWVEIQRYGSQDEANLDAVAGRVDFVFADKIVLQDGFLQRDIGQDFEQFGPELTEKEYFGEGISIAVRKEEQELADRFSKAITAIRANGEYQKVNDKYFDYDIYGLDQ